MMTRKAKAAMLVASAGPSEAPATEDAPIPSIREDAAVPATVASAPDVTIVDIHNAPNEAVPNTHGTVNRGRVGRGNRGQSRGKGSNRGASSMGTGTHDDPATSGVQSAPQLPISRPDGPAASGVQSAMSCPDDLATSGVQTGAQVPMSRPATWPGNYCPPPTAYSSVPLASVKVTPDPYSGFDRSQLLQILTEFHVAYPFLEGRSSFFIVNEKYRTT